MPVQLTHSSSEVPLMDATDHCPHQPLTGPDTDHCHTTYSPRNSVYSTRRESLKMELQLKESLDEKGQVELDMITPAAEKLKKYEEPSSEESSLDDLTSCCPCCPNCNPCHTVMTAVEAVQNAVREFINKHRKAVKIAVGVILVTAYLSFLTLAVLQSPERAMPLIIITILAVLALSYRGLAHFLGERINDNLIVPMCAGIDSVWPVMKWFVYVSLLVAAAIYIAVVVAPHPRQLVSFLGMFLFFSLMFLFSKHPGKVKMRPVLWGIGLQFVFGVTIIRTSWGQALFRWVGQRINIFLDFTNEGASFVYGNGYQEHFFAFKVLSVVVFFSSFINILYQLGVMQAVVQKMAWIMQKTMQTAATESLIAASNIFVGQSEAPILVRPFIEHMTMSELHAMMTVGFSTIAGGVMAAYIMFGVPAQDLLCASVMNAPIALAVSKLTYPETEKSQSQQRDIDLPKGTHRNILEAASAGASASISLVANIAASLISFLALLAFVNSLISWAGSLVDHPEWTFQLLCSYVFMPFAWLMGTEWQDCGHVAELLGIKIFLNEFVAYQQLGTLIRNRENGLEPQISLRSQTIVTYALCGFANLSSIAIQLGGIGPMAPGRKGDLAQLAVRALIAGNIACYITACMAGILTMEDGPCHANSTLVNSTCVSFIEANLTSQLP